MFIFGYCPLVGGKFTADYRDVYGENGQGTCKCSPVCLQSPHLEEALPLAQCVCVSERDRVRKTEIERKCVCILQGCTYNHFHCDRDGVV